ncbi:hypothetical protein PUNSTDRAFT_136192 [Punctularia strigosozonata HHB-11173 SS5]|uniref:uncharacterized protein n=1 Tax=Punctularia strigosozonata (strain HHB-11173) TaxID=741275 RepID=UPI00044181B1|nr:uncharacterized protein PUNSTDRAFT_136192 [Punctularia strigosozonata HHB-11173 SS5]EIN07513.1 hypothetical protein PUNSTDRAFT_136192 [Punctularia strigosozonata HHB-11173 SS5]
MSTSASSDSLGQEIPVNVEDCFTAVRALETGVKELKGQKKNPVKAQFAIIGGVAVAALTRPYANKYPTTVINFPNVIKRQTKINLELQIQDKNTLAGLWTALNGLGYLPHGVDDPISAPGGNFMTSAEGNKYLLDREYDATGHKRSRKLAQVPFDISELDKSRLLDYMDKGQVFSSASIVDLAVDGYPTKLPTFRPHVVLLLKIEGASQREQTTQKDFVDIGLLVALAADLSISHTSFNNFRSRDAWRQRIVPAARRWADKSNKKAETVVNWLADKGDISKDPVTKQAATKLWEAYFATLLKFIV